LRAGRSESRLYWRARVHRFGRRAAIHLDHPESEFDAVTTQQREDLLPVLAGLLDGSERTVVDFGCGPGRFTADLARLVKGRAIGLDVVPEFVAMAPAAPSVEYRLMKLADSRLPERIADVVWVCLVLGGLKELELQAAADEIRRLLRPAGLLFLVENTTPKPSPGHWTFRSVSEYRSLFPGIALEPRGDLLDLGQQVSIIAGRSGSD
jgi:SAM-dependent methyltransferase